MDVGFVFVHMKIPFRLRKLLQNLNDAAASCLLASRFHTAIAALLIKFLGHFDPALQTLLYVPRPILSITGLSSLA
jgi:hypothetical protein